MMTTASEARQLARTLDAERLLVKGNAAAARVMELAAALLRECATELEDTASAWMEESELVERFATRAVTDTERIARLEAALVAARATVPR